MPDNDFTPALIELAEWKQAASVEAGLRREFLARAEKAEAEVARLRKTLQDIEGGFFSGDLSWGSSSFAVEANWKRMYEALQQIARNALDEGMTDADEN